MCGKALKFGVIEHHACTLQKLRADRGVRLVCNYAAFIAIPYAPKLGRHWNDIALPAIGMRDLWQRSAAHQFDLTGNWA